MADTSKTQNGEINFEGAPENGDEVPPPTVDIDTALWLWASEQLGASFTAENIDASKVKVTQSGVLYLGQDDWFQEKKIKQEIFNNDDNLPITWNYDETVTQESKVNWKLIRSVKSSNLPDCTLKVEYPFPGTNEQPFKTTFGLCDAVGTERNLNIPSDINISVPVTVPAYSTVEACVHIKSCHLDSVPFKIDVTLYGPITVTGHKKRKTHQKMEVTDSIAKALKGAAGLVILEADDKVCCTLEGVCNGDVPISVKPLTVGLQSLV